MNMDLMYLPFSLLQCGYFQFLTIISNFDEFTLAHLSACSELTVTWRFEAERQT